MAAPATDTPALPWHHGELAVQARVGESDIALRSAGAIRRSVPPALAAFLTEQTLLVVAARDDEGAVWASPLVGPPGFASAPDPGTLAVAALPGPHDPLRTLLAGARGVPVGFIAIEPSTRRRARLNGRATTTEVDGTPGLVVELDQVFGNCPKYIPARGADPAAPAPTGPAVAAEGLDDVGRRMVVRADSVFLGTTDDLGDADASHRGGRPGFLAVERSDHDDVIVLPDYAGNSMYTTLGNLEVQPRAGLLVPDWSTGATLHLTGTAVVDFDRRNAADVPGAHRLLRFTVERSVRLPGGLATAWGPGEASRFSPPPPGAGSL